MAAGAKVLFNTVLKSREITLTFENRETPFFLLTMGNAVIDSKLFANANSVSLVRVNILLALTVKVTLQSIRLSEPQEDNIWSWRIRSAEEQDLLKINLSTFARSSNSYPGYDTDIRVDVGAIECAYLHKSTQEFLDYLGRFQLSIQSHVETFASKLAGIFEEEGEEEIVPSNFSADLPLIFLKEYRLILRQKEDSLS